MKNVESLFLNSNIINELENGATLNEVYASENAFICQFSDNGDPIYQMHESQ